MAKDPRPEALCPTCKRPCNVVRDGDVWRMIRHPKTDIAARGYCDGGSVTTQTVIAWTESRQNDAAQKVRGFIASMDAANADHERRVAAIREQLTADHAEERALQRLVDKLRFGK